MSYKVKDLRSQAKALGLKGHSTATKDKLIVMLEDYAKANNGTQTAFVEVPKAEPTPVPEPVRPAPHPVVEATNEALASVGVVKKARDVSASPWHKFLDSYTKEHNVSRKVAMSKKEDYEAFKAKLTA